MTRRCHLCGREGSRGYVEAIAATFFETPARRVRAGFKLNDLVTICAARAACNQRRGAPA
jgi:hypothetical protein